MINPFSWLVNNVFWRFVFFWKKQTGWLDLDKVVEATGTVLRVSNDLSQDGDVRFDLQLDPGQKHLITGFGGRLTHGHAVDVPALHCEIVPWDREKTRDVWENLKAGDRVRVKGRWGFDGVHTGKGKVADVFLAIIRHQPNMNDGWFEIHPVEELEPI